MSISCYYTFFLFFLDVGGYHRPSLLRVWISLLRLVYVVQEEGSVVIIIVIPTPLNARPSGVGDGDTANEGGASGF